MEIPKKTLNASQRPGNLPGGNGAPDSPKLLEKALADTDTVLNELGSQLDGLSEAEADSRLKQVGTNEIAREKHQSALMRLFGNIMNPLVLLLLALGVLSYLTGNLRAMVVIFVMVVLGVVLRFFQEMRADQLDLRLPDILHDAVRVQLLAQPGFVPNRLVCRVALHPDADHSHHPHQQDPVYPELGQLATHYLFGRRRHRGRRPDGFAPGRRAQVCPTSTPVLVATGDHIGVLCDPDPVSEELVWPMMAMAGSRHSLTKKSQPIIPGR
jgi:hypothetical protein